jgi:adenine phosphoribosyltransferase
VETSRTARADALEFALRQSVRDIPDFPKPGIVYKDITPILRDPRLFARTTEAMASPFLDAGVTHVAAIESRGFILGAPVALRLGAGFVPVRKVGKLPFDTHAEEYALEYGTDHLEVHVDAAERGSRILIVDDVLATGGTAGAACRLMERLGGEVVGCSFLIALSFLPGVEALRSRPVSTLLVY